MNRLVLAAVLILAVLIASPCAAQTVTNPSKVQYDVSADHAQLTKYELAFFLVGATAPVQTSDLAIVAPTGQTVTQALPSTPSTFGVEYVARIRPWAGTVAGEWSTDSNGFTRVPLPAGNVLVKK
jgi:hypothetical protein